MSKKEDLLSEIKKLSKKIGSVKVYFNQHITSDNDGMGYYFDEKDKLWKSYVCGMKKQRHMKTRLKRSKKLNQNCDLYQFF